MNQVFELAKVIVVGVKLLELVMQLGNAKPVDGYIDTQVCFIKQWRFPEDAVT